MPIWEFVVTGRMFINAHCEHDALQAVMDAALDSLSSVEVVELVAAPRTLEIVTD